VEIGLCSDNDDEEDAEDVVVNEDDSVQIRDDDEEEDSEIDEDSLAEADVFARHGYPSGDIESESSGSDISFDEV
jgi:hypothetical protein